MPGTVTAKGLTTPGEKRTAISALAGQVAPRESLLDVTALRQRYFDRSPDVRDPSQFVSLGTSGHRGSHPNASVTEAHIIVAAPLDNPPRYGEFIGHGKPLFVSSALLVGNAIRGK